MNWVGQVSIVIGWLGAMIAAFKAISEMGRANDQRRKDLRWKQAEMAKKCLDEFFANVLVRCSLRMIDWDGAIYTKPDGSRSGEVTYDVRNYSLRTEDTNFPPSEEPDAPFIRDAFDSFFDGLSRFEHFVGIQLILFEDVENALDYYVSELSKEPGRTVITKYVQTYGFAKAGQFLQRFPGWRIGAEEGIRSL